MSSKNKTIKDLINSDLREYANYVLSTRAIPHLIDGLKVGQRKALFTALTNSVKPGAMDRNKVNSFAGRVIAEASYHHGDAALCGTIINMSQDWNNNIAIFQSEGNFGSRLVTDASASRYIFSWLNKELYDKWFKDTSIAPQQDSNEDPEPLHYLPIIPFALVNGVNGIATGFACTILPRKPENLVKALLNVLEGSEVDSKLLEPYIHSFKGTWTSLDENHSKWSCKGIYKVVNPTTISINELPIGIDCDAFESVLNKLVDSGEIKDFTNLSDSGGFNFEIKVAKAFPKSDSHIVKTFKLEKKISENINCIFNSQLVQFDSAIELLERFAFERIRFYDQRISINLDRIDSEISWLLIKLRFIELVVSGDIVVFKKTRSQINAQLDKNGFEDKYKSKLVGLPLYSLSQDEIKSIKDKISELRAEEKYWKSTSRDVQFLNDLSELV